MKSLLEKVPRHYWTGALGGIVYMLWLGVAIYLQTHYYYFDQNIFSYTILFMILAPVFLFQTINDWLMSLAYNLFSQVPRILQIAFLISSLIVSDSIFVLIGMAIGKKSEDPKREQLRRRVITILFAIVSIACGCYACFLTILGFLMPT